MLVYSIVDSGVTITFSTSVRSSSDLPRIAARSITLGLSPPNKMPLYGTYLDFAWRQLSRLLLCAGQPIRTMTVNVFDYVDVKIS